MCILTKTIIDGKPCELKGSRTVWVGGKSGDTCLLGVTSKDYLSTSGAKSQGIKQLMAGGGIAAIGILLVPLLSGLFG